MNRSLIPAIIIFISIAIFYFGMTIGVQAPLSVDESSGQVSGGITALKAKKVELEDALEKAKLLRDKIGKLEKNYNAFSDDQLDRLNKMIPDNVDNVQLIIDTDTIARRHFMRIKGAKIEAEGVGETKTASAKTKAIQRSSQPKQGVLTLSFSVGGSYSEFLKFLTDLQNSLRVVDLASLSFNADQKDQSTYTVELKTYWLK